jgi:hypothetical protein
LKMGLICCPETQVTNCQPTPCDIPIANLHHATYQLPTYTMRHTNCQPTPCDITIANLHHATYQLPTYTMWHTTKAKSSTILQ